MLKILFDIFGKDPQLICFQPSSIINKSYEISRQLRLKFSIFPDE